MEMKEELKEIRELKELKAQTLGSLEGDLDYVIHAILGSLIDIKTWIANRELEKTWVERCKKLEPGEYTVRISKMERVKDGRDMVTLEVTEGKHKGKTVRLSK